MVDRTQPPARPWYVVGRPWASEETYIVGGLPRGSGPKGDPHIYDQVLAVPFWCPDCEDPDKEHHTPELHRAALHWTTHCVNQHDPATQLLARAYVQLRDSDWSHDPARDELLQDIRGWLKTEPAGPIPSPETDEEQTTITDLLDIPLVETVGLCRCGGDVRWDPEDDISWCTNGCPGGPDLIDREALP